MMVEWMWKANSIDRVASPIGAELVSVVVEIVKKVEAEEKLAEKDKEIERLKTELKKHDDAIIRPSACWRHGRRCKHVSVDSRGELSCNDPDNKREEECFE